MLSSAFSLGYSKCHAHVPKSLALSKQAIQSFTLTCCCRARDGQYQQCLKDDFVDALINFCIKSGVERHHNLVPESPPSFLSLAIWN